MSHSKQDEKHNVEVCKSHELSVRRRHSVFHVENPFHTRMCRGRTSFLDVHFKVIVQNVVGNDAQAVEERVPISVVEI